MISYKSLGFLGYPNYRVDSLGNVWTNWSRRGCTGPWRKSSIRTNSKGRQYVDLYDGKEARKGKRFQVHRLMLIAFVGPCPLGMECRHFPDPDPSNNRLENLRWGTRQENEKDRIKDGTANRGERNGMSKLTLEQVDRLRWLYETGDFSQKGLGRLFRVSQPTVSEIVNDKKWNY